MNDPEPNPKNLTLVIPEIIKWLRNEEGYKNTTVYETMMRHNLSQSLDYDNTSLSTETRPYVTEAAA